MSDDPARRVDRRRALAALAGIAGLAAGCMGGDTDGPSQTATETASRTATATETRTEPGTATETATRTETETATRTETETATRTETETAAARCADTGIVVEGPDQTTHCVAAVESDLSIEEYYGFDTETQNSSALVDGMEVTDATIAFVYRNTATGDRSLVVVHDSPDGGTGGAAVMTFQGVDGTEWLVKDDPEPRSSSEAYEVPGETDDDSISVVWGWSGDTSLTDGGAIGPLDESFDITVTHHQEGTARETTSSRDGVDRWLFVDGADLDDPIELAEFTDENSGDKSIRVSTTDGGDGGDTAGDEDSSGDDTGGSDGDGETTDDGSTESGDDSTPTEEGEETPTRELSGEASNDLTGLEVVDHEAAVGEKSFSGTVTVRNVGDETATLVDHAIDFKLYETDESILTTIESWGSENKEPAPGEESVMEFFEGPAVDADLTLVESYVVELTCGKFETGVYCPEE